MCWQLAEVFRESNSRGKIIEVIPSAWEPVKNQPDAIVVSTDESWKLVAIIRENLRETRSEDDERLTQLASQAAVEQDPNKLMKLVEEINRLLEKREKGRPLPSSGDEQ
jgi:ethanolamine utilization protein EutA (predicted chaperonin)